MATAGFIFAPQGKLPHTTRWPEDKLRKKYGGYHDGGPLHLDKPRDIANLLAYALYHQRERYRRIHRPAGAGTSGFILNRGGHREFEFTPPEKVTRLPWSRGHGGTLEERRKKFEKEKDLIPWRQKNNLPSLWGPEDELDACVDAIEFCGGEMIAVWTLVDHVNLLRVEVPEPLGGVHISRISIPMHGDQPEFMVELEKFLEQSLCVKNLKRLRKSLETVRFSPARFFSAFGLTGAPSEGIKENPWNDFMIVAQEHLEGIAAKPARVKLLNEIILKKGGDGLRVKPSKDPGTCAAELAWGFADMMSQLGRPAPLQLAERLTLAQKWHDFMEEQNRPVFTRESPDNALKASVSAGQILSRFPAQHARDGIFLVLLGGELEKTIAPEQAQIIWKLACHTEEAGMTVIAFPSADEKKFRRTFKLKDGAFPVHRDWKAAVFIDLPGKRRKSLEESAAEKFKKRAYVLIRLELDGEIKGLPDELPWGAEADTARLRPAAKHLDARTAASALGFRL